MIGRLVVRVSWLVFAVSLLLASVEAGMLVDGSLGAVL
jgi:hypothetical protein